MDNLNKHIDGLFNEKANLYKADESFSKVDFEAIRGKLPTSPNVETTPKNNPSNFFKPSTTLTIAGIVSIIGILFLLNKGKNNEPVKTNTPIESNIEIAKNSIVDNSENKNSIDSLTGNVVVTKTNSENIVKINKDKTIVQPNLITTNPTDIIIVKDEYENKIDRKSVV